MSRAAASAGSAPRSADVPPDGLRGAWLEFVAYFAGGVLLCSAAVLLIGGWLGAGLFALGVAAIVNAGWMALRHRR